MELYVGAKNDWVESNIVIEELKSDKVNLLCVCSICMTSTLIHRWCGGATVGSKLFFSKYDNPTPKENPSNSVR